MRITLKDLASNEEYQYTITSGYYTSKEESVESEIVVGKTLANEMSRPIINGPDKVTVPLNGSTTFRVQASDSGRIFEHGLSVAEASAGKKVDGY